MNNPTLLLIARHGNTFGPGDTVTRVGTTDLPLVESGLLQGQRLGAYLNQHHLIPDVIFTSKLKRTIQTAEQVQKTMNTTIPMDTLSIFNEIDYGPDENQPEDKVIERLGTETLQAWENTAKVPQGWNVNPQELINNWHIFSNRITREYQGKIILVITSNGIARFAPHLTRDFITFTQKNSIKISTGALCIFEKKESCENWSCLRWNIKPQ